MPDEQGGIVEFVQGLIDTVADVGFDAISETLHDMAPEDRKAGGWILVYQLVGWARNAGPDGIPQFEKWLAGLPPAVVPAAVRVVKNLLAKLDAQLEATRPN
jgi:hypothetical protein